MAARCFSLFGSLPPRRSVCYVTKTPSSTLSIWYSGVTKTLLYTLRPSLIAGQQSFLNPWSLSWLIKTPPILVSRRPTFLPGITNTSFPSYPTNIPSWAHQNFILDPYWTRQNIQPCNSIWHHPSTNIPSKLHSTQSNCIHQHPNSMQQHPPVVLFFSVRYLGVPLDGEHTNKVCMLGKMERCIRCPRLG